MPASEGVARAAAGATTAQDLRLAFFGSGCMLAGVACLLLAACANVAQRTSPAQLARPPASADPMSPGAEATPPAAAPSTQVAVPAQGFWDGLRAHFSMPGCDYSPRVLHWAHWYTQDPSGFVLSLRQSLPLMMLVAERARTLGVPGEFVLLPYVESNYVPLATSGDHAAGIWQLMPGTARESGLAVGPRYDGRLDAIAATDAALRLLLHYHDVFDNWRLADMAFNAGEFAVRKHFDGESAGYSASDIDDLRLKGGVHAHLAKLLALACVAREPSRFDVRLPEPLDADHLVALSLPDAVDLRLLARLSGLELERLRQLNPAFRTGGMPATGPFRILLPASAEPGVTSALAAIPRNAWRHWGEITLRHDESIDVLARAHDIAPAALAVANGASPDTTWTSGTRVIVPQSAERQQSSIQSTAGGNDVHVVRAGDTLWRIARQARIRVADLLRWNNLAADARLRVGQRIHLMQPAEAAGVAGGVAAGAH